MRNKLLHNPQAVIGTLLIAIILLMGVLAPFLAPHDPMAVDITKKFLEPCNEYPFGTTSWDAVFYHVYCMGPDTLLAWRCRF